MTAPPWPLPATREDDDEADRQLILMALAGLVLRRPGFEAALRRIASRLSGAAMFDSFRKMAERERADTLVRAKIDAKAFRELVAGHPARLQTRHGANLEIEVLLEDMGWSVMLVAIDTAIRDQMHKALDDQDDLGIGDSDA